jgi:hypothetical protein
MTTAVIKEKTPPVLEAVRSNAGSVGSTKSVLSLAKTALGSLGGVMQRVGGSTVASLGGRVQNLSGLFGSMAGGYALNDFGESLSGAVGSALALRRGVNKDAVLSFLGSSALAASDALGAVGFIASRGALALGGAAVMIEIISMAALAIGAALMAVRAFLALRAEQAQIGGAQATPEQAAKLSQLKWTIAKMAMLVAVGLLGLASAVALPSMALGLASTCLMTSFFASDLFTKIKGRSDPKPEETVPVNALIVRRGKTSIFRDQLSQEDAALSPTDPNLNTRHAWAAQERAVGATEQLFASITGQKISQGFIRGFGEVASLVAEAAGQDELAQIISTKSNQVAGGLMPHAEAVANVTGLVGAVKTAVEEPGAAADKAVSIGKAGGKVVADVAKVTSVLANFKVFDMAKSTLKQIDVIGKAGDFTQALLTVWKSKSAQIAPARHPGKAEIDAASAKMTAWNKVREWAKLVLTILALLPPILAAFGRSAPALAMRILSAGAGLTMGIAGTVAHYIGNAGRYKLDPEAVERVS